MSSSLEISQDGTSTSYSERVFLRVDEFHFSFAIFTSVCLTSFVSAFLSRLFLSSSFRKQQSLERKVLLCYTDSDSFFFCIQLFLLPVALSISRCSRFSFSVQLLLLQLLLLLFRSKIKNRKLIIHNVGTFSSCDFNCSDAAAAFALLSS